MKPTQQEIMDVARESGIEWQRNTTITGKVRITTCGSQPVDKLERFAELLLERFGAGGGESVNQWRKAGTSQWWDGFPDHSDGGGPYETRTLYIHPSPTDLRAEYLRGLEDAASIVENADTPDCGGWTTCGIAEEIRALKGKQ